MRVPLTLILLAAGAASVAQAGEDRYGPARARPMQIASAGQGDAAYQGRMLTWSSRAFVPQVPEAPPQVAMPVAPSLPPAPRTEARSPEARIAPPPISPRPEAAPHRQAAPAAPLPESLYSPPPAPAPQRMAQAAVPATPPAEGSHVRLYSVHRQYGLAPDRAPAPAPNGSNYVLIGVPDEGAKPADLDDQPF